MKDTGGSTAASLHGDMDIFPQFAVRRGKFVSGYLCHAHRGCDQSHPPANAFCVTSAVSSPPDGRGSVRCPPSDTGVQAGSQPCQKPCRQQIPSLGEGRRLLLPPFFSILPVTVIVTDLLKHCLSFVFTNRTGLLVQGICRRIILLFR